MHHQNQYYENASNLEKYMVNAAYSQGITERARHLSFTTERI